MKVKIIGLLAASFALATFSAAYASTAYVMFGDNTSRTHENSAINDMAPWVQEAHISGISSVNYGYVSAASSSTAIGENGTLFYPISAPNYDNISPATQAVCATNNQSASCPQGYIAIYNTAHWSGGKPTLTYFGKVPEISNSSPVYDTSTGDAYLAAGQQLHAFNSSGELISPNPNPSNLGSISPIFSNQIVSYPLFVPGSVQGTANDSIWVSSQNGNLYDINPVTLNWANINGGFPISLGTRLDGSPTLVTGANGNTYIAVAAAYAPGNKYPAGTLFLINPRTGKLSDYVEPTVGGSHIASVSAPIATSQGDVAWSDINGNIFYALIDNGKFTAIGSGNYVALATPNISLGAEKSEAGFANGDYILPLTSTNKIEYANTTSGTLQSLTLPNGYVPVGSPEITSHHVYVDTTDGFVQLSFNGSILQIDNSSGLTSSASGALTTPSLLMLDSDANNGVAVPTLTTAANNGLYFYTNSGANYTFGGDYTSTQSAQFTTPLALILGANDLPNIGNNDQIAYSMSVNGGSFNYVTESSVYSGNTPQSQINLSTSLLNGTFAPWKQSGWQSGQTNTVTIRAYAPSSDQYGYTFNSADSGQNQPNAAVTVTFPAGTAIPPQTNLCSPGNNNCIDSLTGYVILRTIPPGSPDKQGALAGYPPNIMPQHHVYQDTPIAESTDGSHSGVYSIGITDGYAGTVTFTLEAEIDTVVDQSFPYTYISGWTPIYGVHGGIIGYDPVYNTITLHHNLPATETAQQTFTITDGQTELWNPWNVTATIQGGNPSTMSLRGFAPFGAWVSPADAFPSASHAQYSQGGNLNGYLNYTGGTYPLNATYGDSSTTNFAPYDAAHNDGVLVEPNANAGDNPGAVGWTPQLKVTAISGQQYFSHPEIYDYMQTWNAGIGGTNVGKSDGSATTATWKWVPTN